MRSMVWASPSERTPGSCSADRRSGCAGRGRAIRHAGCLGVPAAAGRRSAMTAGSATRGRATRSAGPGEVLAEVGEDRAQGVAAGVRRGEQLDPDSLGADVRAHGDRTEEVGLTCTVMTWSPRPADASVKMGRASCAGSWAAGLDEVDGAAGRRAGCGSSRRAWVTPLARRRRRRGRARRALAVGIEGSGHAGRCRGESARHRRP